MKKLTIGLIAGALLSVPFFASATPISWDFANGILQPLQSAWSAVVKADHFVATSTATASILPYASTTAISSSNLTSGNCVQASTGGLLVSAAAPCGSGSGGSDPFTHPTYSGTFTSATTTPLWAQGTSPFSLIASSTFTDNASTTDFSNSDTAYFGSASNSNFVGAGTLAVGSTTVRAFSGLGNPTIITTGNGQPNVNGSNSAAASVVQILNQSGTSNIIGNDFRFYDSTTNTAPLFARIAALNTVNTSGAYSGDLGFVTSSAGALVINAYITGSTTAAIGFNPTVSPLNILSLNATSSLAGNLDQLNLRSGRNNITSTNNLIGGISFQTNDASFSAGLGPVVAAIRAVATATHDQTTIPTDLSFSTTIAGGIATSTEKMRLTGAGNLGIGTTSPYSFIAAERDSGGSAGTVTNPVSIVLNDTGANTSTWDLVNPYASLVFSANDATGGAGPRAAIGTVAQAANGQFNRLGFFLKTVSATAPTEMMSLVQSSSNVANFGIGTTTPASRLAVSGGGSFGADYNVAAPSNGLLVEGKVGIGTTSPLATLGIAGSLGINTHHFLLNSDGTASFEESTSSVSLSSGLISIFGNITMNASAPFYSFYNGSTYNVNAVQNAGNAWNNFKNDPQLTGSADAASFFGAETHISNTSYTGNLNEFIAYEAKDYNGAFLHLANQVGFRFAGTGNASTTAGLVVANITGSYNNLGIVLGQTALPTGNYGIYNSLAYDNYFSGKIGIGTTSPSSLLTVYGSDSGTTITNHTPVGIGITNSNTTANNFSALSFSQINSIGATTTDSKIVGIHSSHTSGSESGILAFLTKNAGTLAEKMRLTAAGFLGIGSTTPGTLLSLGNTGADTINISNTATSTFGHGINILGGCYAINGTCLSSGSGGTPGGSNTDIQYNNSGSFGGSDSLTLTFDGNNNPDLNIGSYYSIGNQNLGYIQGTASSTGTGGGLFIFGGDGSRASGNGNGGDLELAGGSAENGNGTGGNLILQGGSYDEGSAGHVEIYDVDSGQNAIFDGSGLSADRTFTFPNFSGKFFVNIGSTPHLGACGTATISATSTDSRGTINITGGTPTTCNITFSAPEADTPTCVVSDNSSTILSDINLASTTGVQFGIGASFSGRLHYICLQ